MKNILFAFIAPAFICCMLAGCIPIHKSQSQNVMVKLAPGQQMRLPLPAQFGMNMAATQLLSAQYGTKTLNAQVQVELNTNKLVLVALGGWGGQLFSIDYNGMLLKTSHIPMPNSTIGTQSVLRDFILTYAPAEELKKQLEQTDIKLLLSPKMRILTLHGKPILKIQYANANPWKGSVELTNIIQHYKITITTVSYKKRAEQ